MTWLIGHVPQHCLLTWGSSCKLCMVSTVQNNVHDEARRTNMRLTLCLCSVRTLETVRQCDHKVVCTARPKYARQHSTAQHTIGADTHTQHFVSHVEGACVVDGELAGLRPILFHDGPLPKLDFLIGAAAHKATAVMQHMFSVATSDIANVNKIAQTACEALHASEG